MKQLASKTTVIPRGSVLISDAFISEIAFRGSLRRNSMKPVLSDVTCRSHEMLACWLTPASYFA